MAFNRGLSDAFVDLLQVEAEKGGWWRDVLEDPTLLIGVREEYLNVYWQGQALFTLRRLGGTLGVTTHQKFLLDPDLKDQVALEDGRFITDGLRARGFISQFEAGKTLPKMKRAAQVFAGAEKEGCHAIAEGNGTVVDFEVALPIGAADLGGTGRIDLACFLESKEGVQLTFWEAKHFANRELRARVGDARVVGQIKKYAAWIATHRVELENSYRRIAQNLKAFKEMGWKRTLHPSITAVAEGMRLSLNNEQPVGLLIFGFDQDQKVGLVWAAHREKLAARIEGIVPLGHASKIRLPARATDGPVEEILPLDDTDEISA